MITAFLVLFAIAFLFDGIKILIETLGTPNIYEGNRLPNKTTAVVSVYNNETILDAIDSIKTEFSQIIIINDGSTDSTSDIIKDRIDFDVCEDNVYTGMYKGVKIQFIDREENNGKVDSIHYGLQFVDTDYVFICDDDIKFSDDFEIPTTLLEDNVADAISFFVIPEKNKKKLWYNIQLHEYIKSMQIGRRFAGSSKSVECISGCAGLFKTERIKELSLEHSTEWEGEDLERTLIELINDGRVVYSEQLLYTDVPKSFMGITKQRVLAWWGGLYRNIPKFFKIFRSKKTHKRLRFETLYNIVSLILDPFKLISLIYLIVTFNWIILGLLYLIYVLFEYFIYSRYKSISKEKPKLRYILFYPIYGIMNLVYRILAGIYMGYRKFRKVFFATTIILFSLVSLALAQDDTKGVASYEHTFYNLGNTEWQPNHSAYIGYDKFYVSGNYGLYDQINAGVYYKNFLFDVGYRKNTITPYILYEHWLGYNTVRAHARYNYNYGNIDSNIYPNTTVVGVGYGYYRDKGRFIFDAFQELDRYYATTFVAKAKQQIVPNLNGTLVGSVNLDTHYMYSARMEAYIVTVGYTYFSNYDFTGKNLNQIHVGFKFDF